MAKATKWRIRLDGVGYGTVEYSIDDGETWISVPSCFGLTVEADAGKLAIVNLRCWVIGGVEINGIGDGRFELVDPLREKPQRQPLLRRIYTALVHPHA